MKKNKYGWKLSRGQGARKALYRSMIKALVEHGEIKTTKVKSRAIRSEIERIVSLAKKDSIANRRRVYAKLGNDRKTTEDIFKFVAPKFKDRNGGFIRIKNLGTRRGDRTEMVKISWTEEVVKEKPVKKTDKKDTKKSSKEKPDKTKAQK